MPPPLQALSDLTSRHNPPSSAANLGPHSDGDKGGAPEADSDWAYILFSPDLSPLAGFCTRVILAPESLGMTGSRSGYGSGSGGGVRKEMGARVIRILSAQVGRGGQHGLRDS